MFRDLHGHEDSSIYSIFPFKKQLSIKRWYNRLVFVCLLEDLHYFPVSWEEQHGSFFKKNQLCMFSLDNYRSYVPRQLNFVDMGVHVSVGPVGRNRFCFSDSGYLYLIFPVY